ncbi:hypothetical protein GM921_07740 [Pedobacter sp. LMG 31464]|uniref:HTH luxR-type domain-containing protein n=2 Tax=Pedobacter planticolens TaxID=2679964 RepID=A0A923DZB2_9SPHI|nr:hypothetical protein [Pedobacter planticolens]
MYDILGRQEYGKPVTHADYNLLAKAIEIAHSLKDNQLKAELYALFAQLNLGKPSNFLLYNLKAVELQRKIGFQHFSFVHNRFFNISYALFHTKDYKESISFGRECLTFKNVDVKKWDPRVYLFQLDMIGASYLKLGKCDSSIYFYQQIIDTLTKKPDPSPAFQKLWLGIARGNIGHAFIMQGKEAQGLPLVKEQLNVGIENKMLNNAAIAQNILAEVDFKHYNYELANSKWKSALRYAIKGNDENEQISALKGIAESYLYLRQPDSAQVYNNRYQKLKEKQTAEINASKLDRLSSQMAFDNLQGNYDETNNKLSREKLLRNFILIGIILLTIIAILIYSRASIRANYRQEEQLRKQKETEKQMLEAREQVIAFSKNILEKDRLIYSLNKALKSHATDAEEKNISTTLLNYVLVTDREWEKFKEMVSNAYPGFFVRLESLITHINPAEERLASLICLQLSDRQMASMLGISKESVTRSKRRLKQRIAIPEGQTLEEYICSLNSVYG